MAALQRRLDVQRGPALRQRRSHRDARFAERPGFAAISRHPHESCRGEPLFLKGLTATASIRTKTWYSTRKLGRTRRRPGGVSAAYYNDYRQQRHPDGNSSLGEFPVSGKGVTFSLRGEFFNAFNRTMLGSFIWNPTASPLRMRAA